VRVLLSRGAEDRGDGWGERYACLLAENGPIVKLHESIRLDFRRRLTAAEVHAVRIALVGERRRAAGAPDDIVGYICGGRPAVDGGAPLVAAGDHVNLTWRSPLAGGNDDRVGPRFPALAGCYAPDIVESAVRGDAAAAVVRGGVAGVVDHDRPTAFENRVARELRVVALSSELVPVVILAAHLGLRVAALVLTEGARSPSTKKKE
jgi:hypothetical protein